MNKCLPINLTYVPILCFANCPLISVRHITTRHDKKVLRHLQSRNIVTSDEKQLKNFMRKNSCSVKSCRVMSNTYKEAF